MMSEGVEQTPDRPPPERPPIVFVRVAQKCEYVTEKPTADYWESCAGMTIFSLLRGIGRTFFSLRRENVRGPLCKDDT